MNRTTSPDWSMRIWPFIAVKNLWILVGIGLAVTIATIAFNEVLRRKKA